MLRIRVELVPGGREHLKHEVARAELGNLSHLAARSDYSISASEGPNPTACTEAWASRGNILGHDREQTVWRLVEKAAAWAANESEKF